MRRFILMAALLLAGCWTGEGLYSAGEARQPLPAGTYRAEDPEGEIHLATVTLLANGLTRIGDAEGKGLYGFVPLGDDNRRFIVWYRGDNDQAQDRSQLYLLLERRSNEEFVMLMPSCEGETAEIARSAGATAKTGMASECQFPTRASVENAMRQLQVTNEVIKLVRIRD